MNKKNIKTKESKERIINCAIKMFGERGYDNFTISALCKTFGISKGLLYHNFSGKDELFLYCVKICYEKMLNFLNRDSVIPTIEEYVKLRLEFFKENPLLSRIFFESFIQTNSQVFDDIKKIRNSLIDFNRLVYSNFIATIELRKGISNQDAMDYFEMLQKMFNSYYSGPAFRSEDIDALEAEHRHTLSKFLECIIWGVSDKK